MDRSLLNILSPSLFGIKLQNVSSEESRTNAHQQDPPTLRQELQDPATLKQELQDPPTLRQELQDPPTLRQELQDPPTLRQELQDPPTLRQELQDPPTLRPELQDPPTLRQELQDPPTLRPELCALMRAALMSCEVEKTQVPFSCHHISMKSQDPFSTHFWTEHSHIHISARANRTGVMWDTKSRMGHSALCHPDWVILAPAAWIPAAPEKPSELGGLAGRVQASHSGFWKST
ncbi:hypothetical protein P4O66_004932, partial [Electrophorus voltai]